MAARSVGEYVMDSAGSDLRNAGDAANVTINSENKSWETAAIKKARNLDWFAKENPDLISTFLDGNIKSMMELIERIPGYVIAPACGLMALAMACCGFNLSFFYLLPILLISWKFPGRTPALLMWLVCAVSCFMAGDLLGHVHPSLVVPVWNGAMEFGVLLMIAYSFSTLKSVLVRERSFARVDYLTELPNARHFHEQAEIEFARSARYNRPLSIVVADIDNFKYVNDNFGHATGDRLLHAVAKTLQKTLRRTDVVARIGGDEFAIVLSETDSGSAVAAMAKVRDNLSMAVGKHGWPVTFSMGIVTRLGTQCSLKDSMKTADALMYTAKKNGKNMILTENLDSSLGQPLRV